MDDDVRVEALGFGWCSDQLDWPSPAKRFSTRSAVHHQFTENTPQYVHNITSALGNPLTVPEVQILQSRTTVGGRKLADHDEVVALLSAFGLVAYKTRPSRGPETPRTSLLVTKALACRIQGALARHEDMDAGGFRGEGASGETYNFHWVGRYCPSSDEDGGEALNEEFNAAAKYLNSLDNPVERALAYYCLGVRNYFLRHANKRAALLMTNALLLSAGCDAISVRPSQLEELNDAIDAFLHTGDATAVMFRLLSYNAES